MAHGIMKRTMKLRRGCLSFVAIAAMVGLAGCSVPGLGSSENPGAVEREVRSDLTWEEAKAETQERTREIVTLFPAELVSSSKEGGRGVLYPCSETLYNWHGWTRVYLTEGTDVQATLRELVPVAEAHYRSSDFSVSTGQTIVDTLRVVVENPNSAEIYLVDQDDPSVIKISSSSDCFPLPEGVYPGGEF